MKSQRTRLRSQAFTEHLVYFSRADSLWCSWNSNCRCCHLHQALGRPGMGPGNPFIGLYDFVKLANIRYFSHNLLKLLSFPNYASSLNCPSWQVVLAWPGSALWAGGLRIAQGPVLVPFSAVTALLNNILFALGPTNYVAGPGSGQGHFWTQLKGKLSWG